MTTTILAGIAWACVIFTLLCAVWSWRSNRRVRQINAQVLAGWESEAPRLPPVEVVLRTGETLLVEARLIDRVWMYEIDAPPPEQVREIVYESPLHCAIVPKIHK